MSRDDDWGGRRPRGQRRDDVFGGPSEGSAEPERVDRLDSEAGTTSETRPHTHRATTDERRRRGILAGLLALLLVLGVAAVALLRGTGDDADAACGEDPVSVAVAPELAETMRSALRRVSAQDGCARYSVDAVGAAQVASSINEGQAPDVWVPDSSTWVDAVDPAQAGTAWGTGPSVALSPVALAVGEDAPRARARVSSWASLFTEQQDFAVANPDVDTASRLAYHASRIGEPDRIGLRTGSRLIVLSRFAAPSVRKVFTDYEGAPRATAPFPASEQAIAAWDEEHPDAPPLRAVLPRQGTLTLDYPWLTNPALQGEALRHAEAARAQFGTLEMRKDLELAGFRSVGGGPGPRTAGRAADRLVALTPLTRKERIASVDQWDVLRTDMRMLPIVDVSGSMAYASPTPGVTRFQVAQGALLKGLGILPNGSKIGGWIFSSDKGGKGVDHKELAPVLRLDSRVAGGGSHRERLQGLIERSDSYLGGDTGLYDSIWAGYSKMSKEYDPDYVNSIVVVTDGENDDPNGGLSLRQLLAKIDEAYDPKKPVRIITIGMGEADPKALREIADASGGTAHIAETPGDIQRVFVESLLARRAS